MIRFNVIYHVFITNFDQSKTFSHPEFELRVSQIEHDVTAVTTVTVTKKLQSCRALLMNRHEAPKLNHHIMIVL